jgi:hypothetical protein
MEAAPGDANSRMMLQSIAPGGNVKDLTPFEMQVLFRVLECAAVDPTLSMEFLGITPVEKSALHRIVRKLRPK